MKPYQKTIIFFLSILILLFLPICTAETNETDAVNQIPYTGNGSGTLENPYQITSVEQLNEVRNHMNSSFILMNDLDFAKAGITNWIPIGREKELYEAFTGNFDGNNKTIYNMATHSPEDANFGLFYQIAKGTVCNLNFENATVSFGEFYGGILTAMIGPDSTVENCHISNSSVNGSPWCGILSGHIHNSTIRNCTVSNSVLNASAGGIIVSDNKGNVTDSHVDNCTLITAGGGGITGHNSYGGNVKNCSVTDTIIQTELSAGGISGSDWNGKIENCYSANVTITAKEGDTPYGGAATLGGIVGNIRGSKIENC
ncbi:hypothetical protein LJC08_04605, partial [Methanimicrococcus sp. OttesenSCG-928-J09]|nr:hypothetical protein [Methanimicrococcus sp. OttesenSCG-928-J09]